MGNQERFLKLMDEIRQIAATQHNYITKEDIGNYLEDMDISSKQLEAVYNYLAALGIVVEGHHYNPDIHSLAPESNSSNTEKPSSSDIDPSKNDVNPSTFDGLRKQKSDKAKSRKKAVSKSKKGETDRAERNRILYQRDLRQVKTAEGDELVKLVSDFLDGDEKASERFIENRLKLVVKLAGKYRKMDIVSRGIVPIEEVIAEGNLGLLIGVDAIRRDSDSFLDSNGKPDLSGIDELLRIEIIRAMESCIVGAKSGKDMENAMLARINLLHEAAKYMTEEMGRIPLKEELAEYTKIPVDEIVQIMGLSEDAKRISDW